MVNSQMSFASNKTSNVDLIKEIEKSLILDKNSRQKIDLYYPQKAAKKKSNFNIIKGNKKFDGEARSVKILVAKSKIDDLDLREKEHLAYKVSLVGQYEVAIQLYKQILRSEPNNSYAKFSLATAYQKIKQFSQAKTLYQQLLKSNYENRDAVIGNLLTILIEESPKDSVYLLSRLSVQNPKSSDILAHAAVAYDKIKDYDKAISLLERAIAISPNNLEYRYNLAVVYDKAEQYENALKFYLKVEKDYSDTNQSISINQVRQRVQFIKNKL